MIPAALPDHDDQRRCIFISGGAAGIGAATAQHFARAGWRVGVFDLHQAGAEALVAQLPGTGHLAGQLDVADAAGFATQLQRFVASGGGRLDVLFNNAGIAVTALFGETPLERHHRVIEVNLKGTLNGCHAALPHLRSTPGARVINMCSASALFGQPMLATYSATKAAVRSLTEALDIEWSREGIRVVDVLPLFVDTAMVRDSVRQMATVDRLGVRLSAHDVAHTVWRLANAAPQRLPVHSHVGLQTRLSALLTRLSPVWLTRRTTAWLAGFQP